MFLRRMPLACRVEHPIAAEIYFVQSSWLPVFAIIITLAVLTAILAYFVLMPLCRNWLGLGDDRHDSQPARVLR